MEHDPFRLPTNERGEVLPGELDSQFLAALDQAFARQETRQLGRLDAEEESRGFLRSGVRDRRVIEEILGPSIERRQMALLPLAKESALRGREERLGETQFQRSRQLQVKLRESGCF